MINTETVSKRRGARVPAPKPNAPKPKEDEKLKQLGENLRVELESSPFKARVVEASKKQSESLDRAKASAREVSKEIAILEEKLVWDRKISLPERWSEHIAAKKLGFSYEMGQAERALYNYISGNSADSLSRQRLVGCLDTIARSPIGEVVQELVKLNDLYDEYKEDYSALQRTENDVNNLLAYKKALEDLLTEAIEQGIEPVKHDSGDFFFRQEEEMIEEDKTDLGLEVIESTGQSQIPAKVSNRNSIAALFSIMILLMAIYYKLG